MPSVPQLCGPSRVTQQGGKLSLRKRILKQVQGRSTPGSFTSRWLRCRVDVCLGTLKLIQAGDEELSTSYQENGVDKFRIKNVTSGRRCKCSWNCTQQVPTDELQEICNLWQRLSDEQQSQYLSVQRYGASEFKPDVKADWFLNGHHVCFRGLARLLGTSEPTLLRRVRMSLDLRKSWVGGPRQMVERRRARNYVDVFSWNCTMRALRTFLKIFTLEIWILLLLEKRLHQMISRKSSIGLRRQHWPSAFPICWDPNQMHPHGTSRQANLYCCFGR